MEFIYSVFGNGSSCLLRLRQNININDTTARWSMTVIDYKRDLGTLRKIHWKSLHLDAFENIARKILKDTKDKFQTRKISFYSFGSFWLVEIVCSHFKPLNKDSGLIHTCRPTTWIFNISNKLLAPICL